MKTITLPVYRRAERLKELLAALRVCSPLEYVLYVQAEPGFQDVLDVVKTIDFIPVSLVVNGERLGLNGNIKAVLERAMADGSEFNVALEDDIVLSPDAFRLAEWFRTGPSEKYAGLGFFAYKSDPARPSVISETQDFRSWGYCFSRPSWERFFVPALAFRHPIRSDVKHQDMWDFWVQFYFTLNGIPTLHPALSRSNHLGLDDGTNALPEIRKYFEKKTVSDGSYYGEYSIERLPSDIWEHARKLSSENLRAAV